MTKRRSPSPPLDGVREPQTVYIKSSTYQPSKAELEEEIDMPGMDDEEIRRTFFRPVKFIRDGSS